MIERHDNGDLVLFASNGDPLLKLQAQGPFVAVTTGTRGHPFDSRAELLDEEAVTAIREWCESVEGAHFKASTPTPTYGNGVRDE